MFLYRAGAVLGYLIKPPNESMAEELCVLECWCSVGTHRKCHTPDKFYTYMVLEKKLWECGNIHEGLAPAQRRNRCTGGQMNMTCSFLGNSFQSHPLKKHRSVTTSYAEFQAEEIGCSMIKYTPRWCA